MPPTTRAMAKGHIVQTKNVKKGGRRKPESKVGVCHFLKLPAEIRNRIYDFAKEYRHRPRRIVPPLLIKPASDVKLQTSPYTRGTREYFALTQTCKQIRLEYRPLWLRGSTVRIYMKDVHAFFKTYYPKAEDYSNGLRLLLASRHQGDSDAGGKAEDALYAITPVAYLRTKCPTTTVKFVSHPGDGYKLEESFCFKCQDANACSCDKVRDHEFELKKAWALPYDDYDYLYALNGFLSRNTNCWQEAFRTKLHPGVKIQFTYNRYQRGPTIYIRLATEIHFPEFFNNKDMYESAKQYLQSLGNLSAEYRYLTVVVKESARRFRCP